MNILKALFGRKVENATLQQPGVFGDSIFTAKTGSGVYVSEDSALKISAVYACVRVLSETLAGLPIKVYRTTENGREAVDHPINQLLNVMPNDTQTAFELTELIMSSLGLRGSSYAQIIRNARGDLQEITPLNARYMKVDQDANGLVFDYQAPGEARVFRKHQIWRVAGLSANGITGLSPVGLARETFGLAAASEMSASRMYSNGAQIPGVLEFPGKLNDDVLKHMREQWAEKQAGAANAHKPLILESGMKYSQIGMSSKDAQFLEARKFQISEIARWFRVPLHKLGELDRATFSNIEHQSIEFVTDTILPWCRRLEQSIQRDLLSETERRTLFVRYNLDGLLRGDTQTRYEAYGKAIQDGWLNRNEVRRMENKNPVDGLDEYLVPLNMGSGTDVAALNADRISNFLATKEINALNNSAPADPQEWAIDYYQRQAENLKELAGLDDEACAAYAVSRIKTITEGGTKAAKASAISAIREAVNA